MLGDTATATTLATYADLFHESPGIAVIPGLFVAVPVVSWFRT